jgi:hypothetical protein
MVYTKRERLKKLRCRYEKMENLALKFRKTGDYLNYIRKLREARRLRIEYLEILSLRENEKSLVMN